jgi:transcriptional regulator with XRE-family HTH domain
MRTSRSAVSSLERGEKLPNVLTLEIAARSLNVPAWLVLQLAEVKVFKSVQF